MNTTHSQIIQGGMGVNISSWQLARTVSLFRQQGTISGVALEKVLARLLQKGDPEGNIRRALAQFPFPDVADRILEMYFVEGGIAHATPFKNTPICTVDPSRFLKSLIVCANFTFVWLAKEGHTCPISINYLEKLAPPHIYAIYGAILAGVDCITMGAGIPRQIPRLLDDLVAGYPATYKITVVGRSTEYEMSFDPQEHFGGKFNLIRPRFIPIIASNLLANVFVRKMPPGSVQGFVVEEPTAGGHNAPPRKILFNELNEPQPTYGPKDQVNYEEIAELGLPFWIGGAKASPERLKWARSVGAQGIQAGTIFALCEESDMDPKIRREIRQLAFQGNLQIKTDMKFSPTGFPFKIAPLKGSLSEKEVYESRIRLCNHGSLAHFYQRPDGSIGHRCPGEPVEAYQAKGGNIADTIGRGCLCNGLISTAGLGDANEPPVVTLGDDHSFLSHLMTDSTSTYTAKDAIHYLLGTI